MFINAETQLEHTCQPLKDPNYIGQKKEVIMCDELYRLFFLNQRYIWFFNIMNKNTHAVKMHEKGLH